jgi:mannose-6-phosphate isomerase-like protein (cupin superfamily)
MNQTSSWRHTHLCLTTLTLCFLAQPLGCATAPPTDNKETLRTALKALPDEERNQLFRELSTDASDAVAPSPLVVNDETAERRQPPSGKAQITIYARGKNAFLAKLEMAPNGSVPVHRDTTEEYIYILEGSGTITIDSKSYAVAPHTAIFMPAGAEVTYQNGDERLVAIQVFSGPEPARKYEAWKPMTAQSGENPNKLTEPRIFSEICTESVAATPCAESQREGGRQ